MKKVLIPVDGTKATREIFSISSRMIQPAEEVILVHVAQLGGKTLMLDMLGEAELETLKEAMQDTPHKEHLDAQGRKILEYYKGKIEAAGPQKVRTILREGIAAQEILKVAEQEQVDLIIMGGNDNSGLDRLISGSTTKDVERGAKVPVLVTKSGGCEGDAFAWGGEAYAVR